MSTSHEVTRFPAPTGSITSCRPSQPGVVKKSFGSWAAERALGASLWSGVSGVRVLVPRDDGGRDAAALADLDPLTLRPRTNVRGALPVTSRPPSAGTPW